MDKGSREAEDEPRQVQVVNGTFWAAPLSGPKGAACMISKAPVKVHFGATPSQHARM